MIPLRILLLLLIFTNFCLDVKSQDPVEHFPDFDYWKSINYGFLIETGQKSDFLCELTYKQNKIIPFTSVWFNLEYSIPLPQDSIFTSWSFKSYSLDSLKLKLFFYGENEEFLDSLIYTLDPNGHNHIGFFNAKATWMNIVLDGRNFSVRDSASLQIHEAGIRAANHNLKDWFRSLDFDLDVASLIPLEKVAGLDELKNKKIIGLGESVHGTETVFGEKARIARKLLSDSNVKLICFENGVDVCLNWDLYVRGIHPYEYRYKILEDQKETFSDAVGTVTLLDHIREVNSTRKERDKIRIVGLDLRLEKEYFFYYFLAYKGLIRDKESLSQLLLKMDTLEYNNLFYLNNIRAASDTLKLHFHRLADEVKSERKLKTVIPENEYRFLLDILQLKVPTYSDRKNKTRQIDRDWWMWKIFRQAVSCYAPEVTDRVVIFSHSLHVSRTYHPKHAKSGFINKRSLGSYIAGHYAEDYWAVSFHVGNGESKYYDGTLSMVAKYLEAIGKEEFQEPLWGSFEKSAKNTLLEKFYCRSNNLNNDRYMLYRMIGNRVDKAQFYPLSKDRFDGYVFINQATSSQTCRSDTRYLNFPYPDMGRYLDSLKISRTPYSKSFAFDTDCFSISISGDLRYRNVRLETVANAKFGFFESKDRNFLVFFEDQVFLYKKGVDGLGTLRKQDLKKRFVYDFMGRYYFTTAYYMDKADHEKVNHNYWTLYGDMLDHQDEEYAQRAFNADQMVEYNDDANFSFLGKRYTHKKVIAIGKNENLIRIYCYYTDQGYADKEKYQKSIESILKFN
ncbi:MAG: erythromycin esterase family protein [Bacteroidales bacterium]|jgi:erythromycin esterase-like protein|nr:erythromycin esterase family protein [Bacteroidales bacterium]